MGIDMYLTHGRGAMRKRNRQNMAIVRDECRVDRPVDVARVWIGLASQPAWD